MITNGGSCCWRSVLAAQEWTPALTSKEPIWLDGPTSVHASCMADPDLDKVGLG